MSHLLLWVFFQIDIKQTLPDFLAFPLFVSIDCLNQKAKSSGGSTTRNSCGSPEFLPPSKIQRLSEENEEEVKDESADLELQASQVDETGKSNAADRLKSMKDKHDKIEDLLVTLEANVRNGWLLLFLFKFLHLPIVLCYSCC